MKQVKRFWPVAALVALCLAGLCAGLIWRAREPYRWSPDRFSEPALVALQERIRPDWAQYGIVLTGMDKWYNRITVYVRDESLVESAREALSKRLPPESFWVEDGSFLFGDSAYQRGISTMAMAKALYGYYDVYDIVLVKADAVKARVYVFLSDFRQAERIRPALEKLAPFPGLYFADGSYIVRRASKYTVEELSAFSRTVWMQPETEARFGATSSSLDLISNCVCFYIADLTRAHELAEYASQYIPADSFYFIEASSRQILG